MARNEDRIKSLELAIEEQRLDYAVVNSLNSQVKTKNITYLAANLALLTYLYGSQIDTNARLKDRLFIPDEPYGIIIYFLALGLILGSLSMLLFALKPRTWLTAYDNNQDDKLMEDYETYLRHTQQTYLKASHNNCYTYSKKQVLIDMALVLLLSGGILLRLLKIFKG